MKKEFTPEETQKKTPGRRYWKSLDNLSEEEGLNQWIEREFPEGASEADGMDRRHFLKIMGASLGLAGVGLSGCRRPEAKILPYSKQPERIIPGVPVYYASSFPNAFDSIPLIVETHEARPTKLEGNPSYKDYRGATNLFAQASVLGLYDPDRSQYSQNKGKQLTQSEVSDLLAQWRKKLQSTGGKKVAFLAERSTSPTRQRLVQQLQVEFPDLFWSEYEPISFDGAERAHQMLTGKRLRPHFKIANAKRILSLDSDFLYQGPGSLGYAKAFADGRKVDGLKSAREMNRLYAVESNFSVTGSSNDHRLRLDTSLIPAFVAALAIEVLGVGRYNASLVSLLKRKIEGVPLNHKWIKECAKDLLQHKRKSLIVAGEHLPPVVHMLTLLMNQALAASGNTVDYLEIEEALPRGIADLAAQIEKGSVDTLFILGGNPVYDAPADLNWESLQLKVDEVIRWGYYHDETSRAATCHLAASHYLESWSDGRTWDGTMVPVQPMIEPLFDTIGELELLGNLLNDTNKDSYSLVYSTFQSFNPEVDTQSAFNLFLAEGVLPESGYNIYPLKNVESLQVENFVNQFDFVAAGFSRSDLELRFIPDNSTWDGRYNNNGWLQECPDPMTKLTWDNAISISPRLAKELNIYPESSFLAEKGQVSPNANEFIIGKEQAPIGRITLNGKQIEGPIHIQPGLADYTVVLPLGYGREKPGRVGEQTGFSAYPLRDTDRLYHATGAKLEVLDKVYPLANTQEHWSMEGRAIVREANRDEYLENPDFVKSMGMESHSPAIYGAAKNMPLQEKVKEIPRGNSLYDSPPLKGPQQWGMTIDLNACIGCNACVIACQSENNIPIVGKDQVLRGREMQWIRLDRYYSSQVSEAGDLKKDVLPEDPQVSFQAMTCQHCELAPCENVCPVNATVHDDQGLNVMAYNRCVGTRYCANNCPYKVRRFNFFDWNKREIGHFYEGPFGPSGPSDLEKMQKNPDVTVRMRGVMEKCTFCVQRVEEAKIHQLQKARDSGDIKVPDGTIKTACQQVCPTEAIVFGDVADPDTEVSKMKALDRNYSVLGYLNTRPRLTYLAKLRNPNPKMPDFHSQPLNRFEYETRYGHGSHHSADHHNSEAH